MANDLITTMAAEQGLDRSNYWQTIQATVIPGRVNTEQVVAFLAVAHQYGLNPLTKEIYAFPSKGGITPIVSVDGWLTLANRHPQFDGMETEEIRENGQVVAVKCVVYRKDRSRPVTATEYMSECKRPTEPWKQWPVRMLTNKAMIQAIRRAFSFAGIYDPDEGERIHEVAATDYEVTTNSSAKAATDDKAAALRQRLQDAGSESRPYPQGEPVSTAGADDDEDGEGEAVSESAPASTTDDDIPPEMAALGFESAALDEMSMDELRDHANRLRDDMDLGAKRTVKAALAQDDRAALIAVLRRVTKRIQNGAV